MCVLPEKEKATNKVVNLCARDQHCPSDDNPPAQPEDQQHAQEEKRVSQKRKVQEQHKNLRKEEQPSPSSIPPHFQAIEGKTVLTVNKNNCESRLQNVRSLDHKT